MPTEITDSDNLKDDAKIFSVLPQDENGFVGCADVWERSEWTGNNCILSESNFEAWLSLMRAKLHQIGMMLTRGFALPEIEKSFHINRDLPAMLLYYSQRGGCAGFQEETSVDKLKSTTTIQGRLSCLDETYKRVIDGSGEEILGSDCTVHYVDVSYSCKTLSSATMSRIFRAITDGVFSKHVIIVSLADIHRTSVERSRLLTSYRIEFLHVRDLLVDVTRHVLNPQFTLLNATQAANLEMFGSEEGEPSGEISGVLGRATVWASLPLSSLPQMCSNDPVARFFGARPGDVFRVERNNLLYNAIAKHTVAYRVVTRSEITGKPSRRIA